MEKTDCIEHNGVVQQVKDEVLLINIKSESACAACHAKGACSTFDIQDKLIEVPVSDVSYSIGQHVTLVMDTRQGYKALFWAYLFPFFIVFVSLIILIAVTGNELTGGLISLSTLIPYYYWLSMHKDKFRNRFQFKIKE